MSLNDGGWTECCPVPCDGCSRAVWAVNGDCATSGRDLSG